MVQSPKAKASTKNCSKTCMALHLLAKTAELSSDDGFQARQQIHKLPGPWEFDYLEDHPRTCKWLGSPLFVSHSGHLEGEQPYLGDLLTMVIDHFLTGMIIQVLERVGFPFLVAILESARLFFLRFFVQNLIYRLFSRK